MEGMVTDLQLARDKQQNFDEWKREHAADKPLTMDLTVTVLTTGFWPSYKVNTWNGMLLLVAECLHMAWHASAGQAAAAQCPVLSALLPSLRVSTPCVHDVFVIEHHSHLYPMHAVHNGNAHKSLRVCKKSLLKCIFGVIAACGSCTATRDDRWCGAVQGVL